MVVSASGVYSSVCFFRGGGLSPNSAPKNRRPMVPRCCNASLITNPDSFEVGRLIGSYGFLNVTSYSGGLQSAMDLEFSAPDVGKLRVQDIGEGDVKIRLYEGRIVQGPLRRTPVIFKVYPGKQVGGIESDMMAANELSAHASLQGSSARISRCFWEGLRQKLVNRSLSLIFSCLMNCFFVLIFVETLYIPYFRQWLAFRNDGKYTAADYAKVTSEKLSKAREHGDQNSWNPYAKDEIFKRRRKYVAKLLQGAMRGLAYMHDRDRLHQSLGPVSVVVNTMVEKEATYLVPQLRDLAFSVDIRYSELAERSMLSEGLWRRATAAAAFTPLEKRAFGIADDIYEAGLLFAYLAFVPFCETGVMDSLSLRRLLENTFRLDIEAMREYCLADDRLVEAVKFLDLDDRAGWELLQAMLNQDFRQRPIAEAVLNHRLITGALVQGIV